MGKKKCIWLFVLLCFVTLVQVDSIQAQQKPLVLRIGDMGPPTGPRAENLKKACSEVERLTEGRIKMEVYWSGSLVQLKDMPRAVQKGICDISWVVGGSHQDVVPLMSHYTRIIFHPRGDDASWITEKAYELLDTCKPLRVELEKLNQTNWFCYPYDSFPLYSKKMVTNLTDMKGMRLRVAGEGYAKMVSAIGANPIWLPNADTYNALERGVFDGSISGWELGFRYGFHEVVPYVIDLSFSVGHSWMTISLPTLRKMSEKDKQIFMEVGRRMSLELSANMKNGIKDYQAIMQKKGVKILPFPEEERSKWAAIPEVKNLIKDWIDEQNKQGRAGTEVMKTFLKIFDVPQLMPAGY